MPQSGDVSQALGLFDLLRVRACPGFSCKFVSPAASWQAGSALAGLQAKVLHATRLARLRQSGARSAVAPWFVLPTSATATMGPERITAAQCPAHPMQTALRPRRAPRLARQVSARSEQQAASIPLLPTPFV